MRKVIIFMLLVTMLLSGIILIFNNKNKKENEIIDGVEDNNINNEQDGQDTYTNTEKEPKTTKEITITFGLHAGSKNNQKIHLEKDDFFVSPSVLEKMLGDNVKISYIKKENIIKAYYNVANHEEENTFLIMDMDNGIMKKKTKGKFEDEKIKVLPIIQEENILLPLKYILDVVTSGTSNIYYEDDLEILRLRLEDFEIDFLNDFPYDVVGSYVGNSIVSHYQAMNISKAEVIYVKDSKYGLVSYNVEEYLENSLPRGKYLGYNIEVEAKYDEIEFVPYDYNIYILKKDGKNAIYNRDDKTISEEYDLVQEIENGNHDYKVKKNGKYGLYGVSEIIYDDVWYEDSNISTQSGIYGSINGKKILLKELNPPELEVCY